MILFGEDSLRKSIQDSPCTIILNAITKGSVTASSWAIRTVRALVKFGGARRLGGMLNYYYRDAA
jgi:hypothetical protein